MNHKAGRRRASESKIVSIYKDRIGVKVKVFYGVYKNMQSVHVFLGVPNTITKCKEMCIRLK